MDPDDLDVFQGQFGLSGGIDALAADFDRSGQVGLEDFAIMRANFGDSVDAPATPSSAPEALAPAPAIAPAIRDRDSEGGLAAKVQPIPAAMAAPRIVSASKYAPETGPLTAATRQRAATAEYDLRPLGGDPSDDGYLLADILTESLPVSLL